MPTSLTQAKSGLVPYHFLNLILPMGGSLDAVCGETAKLGALMSRKQEGT